MNPKFSIVIPTRNRPELALRAIRSVLAQVDTKDYEIIVADNSDKGKTLVEREDFRLLCIGQHNLTYIPSCSSIAPMWANWELGASFSNGDWIIMLPDKCILSPYALGHLRNTIASDSNCMFITWRVPFAHSWIPNHVTHYNEQRITTAEARRRFLQFDHTNMDFWPHGMNTCYRRFEGHEQMYRPSCPDYQAGLTLTQRALYYLHTRDDIMYIPRDTPIEYSTGAQFTRGLNTTDTLAYLDALPPNYKRTILDWSFNLDYVLKDYGIIDPSAYYLIAAYYRHCLDRWRLGGGWHYKWPVHHGGAFLLFLWRLMRDMVRRLL